MLVKVAEDHLLVEAVVVQVAEVLLVVKEKVRAAEASENSSDGPRRLCRRLGSTAGLTAGAAAAGARCRLGGGSPPGQRVKSGLSEPLPPSPPPETAGGLTAAAKSECPGMFVSGE